jgi:hypothetical protein
LPERVRTPPLHHGLFGREPEAGWPARAHAAALLLSRACALRRLPPRSKVWNAVDNQARKGHTSIIHGKWAHEETIATASFAGEARRGPQQRPRRAKGGSCRGSKGITAGCGDPARRSTVAPPLSAFLPPCLQART